jgi:hypothetical protein
MSQREAFEAHIREEFGEDWLAKGASGDYVERTTRRQFRSWKAAIQHARDVAVKACKAQSNRSPNLDDAYYNVACGHCADAIKEALK